MFEFVDLPTTAKQKLYDLQAASTAGAAELEATGKLLASYHTQLAQMRPHQENAEKNDLPWLKKFEGEIALLEQAIVRTKVKEAQLRASPGIGARGLLRDIEEWGRSYSKWGEHVSFKQVSVDVPKADLRKPGPALERVRQEMAEARAKLSRARSAPPPRAELKQAARRYVEKLVAEHRPIIGRDGNSQSPEIIQPIDILLFDTQRASTTFPLTREKIAAFEAWLDPERLIARLEKDIDIHFNDRNAVSTSERIRLEAETPGRILALERLEEALIEKLHADGEKADRRPDANMLAVLGIEQVSGPRPMEASSIPELNHPELAYEAA